MQFNKEQELAASHKDGPCLVVASPGSGKTSVLTERIARLVESGVSPGQILCVTFTNKAANEMKERIYKRLNVTDPNGSGWNNAFIGTFHAFCAKVLRSLGDKLGYKNFTIIDQDDQKDLIAQIARQVHGEKLKPSDCGYIAGAVNNWREAMEPPEKLSERLDNISRYVAISDEYINRLKINNNIDFSGLLCETVRLFQENNDILTRFQEKFKYISVDETQDTNQVQFFLINILSKNHNNILIIGDINQCVYSFRGSRYQNILDFVNAHKGCTVLTLPENYRSTPQIVAVADKLIKYNKSHSDMKFRTSNPPGDEVECRGFVSQYEEADAVASRITNCLQQGKSPKDIVVLYRMNSFSEPIEQALTKRGIAYQLIGSRSFYDRKEIRDSLALLRFCVNPSDGIAFHRICNFLDGVGDKTIGQIENEAIAEKRTILEVVKRFSEHGKSKKVRDNCKLVSDIFDKYKPDSDTPLLLTKLAEDIGYDQYIKNYCKGDEDQYEDRKSNLKQLVDSAANFGLPPIKYLENVALITSSDKETKDHLVTLMTCHASKGLEFSIVFVIGVEQGILPHNRAISEQKNAEEERRLCYVAFTRAKNNLIVSYCLNRSQYGSSPRISIPSQFLFEAGLLKENSRYHNCVRDK